MSLTTLANIKTALRISGASEDAELKHWLRIASAIVRGYCGRYLGGFLTAASVANPTVITSIGHALETGNIIIIAGSNSTPTIDGERTITRVDDDTFTIPLEVTTAGTAGTYTRKFTEFYKGNGRRELLLRNHPVQSIASVYHDPGGYFGEASDAFPSTSLLTEGEDFVLDLDSSGESSTGILFRIGGGWPAIGEYRDNQLTTIQRSALGNIKVTYNAGYTRIPWDLQDAVIQLVKQKRAEADSGSGGSMQSESLDYYSYTRMSAQEAAMQLGSLAHTLKRYGGKAGVW